MNTRHLRILGIIDDLEQQQDGQEIDEYSVALACGAIPDALPRHAWVKHPSRGEMLQLFTGLDQAKLIYVTRRGYWGFHLTQRGRDLLDATPPQIMEPLIAATPAYPAEAASAPLPQWQGPRPSDAAFAPRSDHFYTTMALAVAALGALLILAFGQSTFSPLARDSAAAPIASATATLPATATPLPVPATLPVQAVPQNRFFIVTNTGGDGVFLRRTPQYGDKMAAWPDRTTLEEIGPERTVNGTIWRLVRAPDSSEGYVPAQYTVEVPPGQ